MIAVVPAASVECCCADTPKARQADTTTDLKIVRQAYESTERAIQSGHAKGRFRYLERDALTTRYQVVDSAFVDIVFARNNFWITMRFDREQAQDKKRIIIHDGGVLATSHFSNLIHPNGAEGDIFKSTPDDAGVAQMEDAHFHWDPAHLHRALSVFPALLVNVPRDKFVTTHNAAGDIIINYTLTGGGRGGADWREEIVCRSEDAYHVKSRRSYDATGKLFQTIEATWTKVGGLWFVKQLKHEFNASTRWELRYDAIEVNPQVNEQLFLFSALELPSGSRILDRTAPRARASEIIVP